MLFRSVPCRPPGAQRGRLLFSLRDSGDRTARPPLLAPPVAPGGLRLIFPATTTGALTNSPQPLASRLPANTSPSASGYNPRLLFPDVVDVMVRILTDTGVDEITNLEKVQTPALAVPQKYNNNAQQWWWGVAEENSRVYTRRVVINAEPL